MAYASVAELKAYLGIATGITTDDALLTAFLARAQRMIDVYCHRTFEASASTTRYFDAITDISTCGQILYFDEDLCQVDSVTNGDGQAVASTDYVTLPRNRKPWFGLRIKRYGDVYWTFSDMPEDAIAVTGRWAYSVTAPSDIVQATVRLAAYLYRQKDNAGDLDRPVNLGYNMTLLPARLPQDVVDMLATYRRII